MQLYNFIFHFKQFISLRSYRYIFAVALKSDVSTPFQIYKGLNIINVQTPSANAHVTNLATPIKLSNLQPYQTYSIYIIAASDLPEYSHFPDALSTLLCTTKKLTDRETFENIYYKLLKVALIIFFIFF
ncbi:unnamed protein product [Paramecium sonneborni]|uniref:Uncharacterized protein n=1 Tax=Paramecium sonneborni TaxID=65129 RepID=A0A8S1QPW1_9CILI|nr:unnamed protein product [Paramecium sonneborni]